MRRKNTAIFLGLLKLQGLNEENPANWLYYTEYSIANKEIKSRFERFK